MREALQIQIQDTQLVGTRHCPEPVAPAPNGTDRTRVGFLMLNPGYLPRSTRGDLGAHLGDHLARLGFPVFRFDMPGLGDSEGFLAPEVLEFFELVQTAGHEAFLSTLRLELVRKYALQGIVYLGHCGGATTAIYSADKNLSDGLLGLILLDPAFVWYRSPPKPQPDAHGLRKVLNTARQRLWDARKAVRATVLQTAVGEKLSVFYAKIKRLARRLQREPLPADANVRLVRSWERVLGASKPVLVLTAEPPKKKINYFDYLGYLERARPGTIQRINIPGTSHSFVEGNGKEEVFGHVQRWVDVNFPRTSPAPLAPAKP